MKVFYSILLLFSSFTSNALASALPIEEFTLDNGMKVVLHTNDSDSLSIRLIVHVGTNNFPDEKRALAHLLEHVLFRDTKTRSAEELVSKIKLLSQRYNAETMDYITVYKMDGKLGPLKGMRYFFEMLASPKITQETITKERNSIYREHEALSGMLGKLASTLGLDKSASNHALNYIDPGANKSISLLSLDNITREDLVAAHQKFYTPNNMTLIIVGNHKKELIQELASFFSKNSFDLNSTSGKRYKINDSWTPNFIGPQTFDTGFTPLIGNESSVDVGYLTEGFHGLEKKAPELDVLGQLVLQLTYEELRIKTGLAYTPEAEWAVVLPSYGLIGANAYVELGKESKAIGALKEVFSRIIEGDFTDTQLLSAKRKAKDLYERTELGSAGIANHMVNHYYEYLESGVYQKLERKHIELSKEQIVDVAKGQFIPSKELIVISSPLLSHSGLFITLLILFLASVLIMIAIKIRRTE